MRTVSAWRFIMWMNFSTLFLCLEIVTSHLNSHWKKRWEEHSFEGKDDGSPPSPFFLPSAPETFPVGESLLFRWIYWFKEGNVSSKNRLVLPWGLLAAAFAADMHAAWRFEDVFLSRIDMLLCYRADAPPPSPKSGELFTFVLCWAWKHD